MAEQLNYNINVSGNASESVGSLKKELREATAQVAILSDKFGVASKEATEAAKRAAELRDRIGDARALTDAFNPDAKFKALSASLSGVAGGFAAVQGAIGLFGGESKELEKQLLKVQSALALSQGLQSIGESIDSFKNLGAVIQSTTIFQKANAAANVVTAATLRAVGVAAETTAIGFKVLKTAIVSTGIGVLLIALGELVSALMNYTSAADKAAKKQKELNEEIVKGTEAGNKAVKEYLKSSAELEELRAKLAGKGEDEILAIRKKSLNAQIEQNKKDYEQLIKLDKVKASALIDENAKLTDELTKLDINFKIEQKKRQEETDKKAIEDNKKKTDEQKRLDQEEQQRIKERNDRESAAQQIQIDAFRSTLDKRQQDILAAEDDFEKKKGELIKAGVTDFTLLQEQYRLKLLEINKNYDKQDEDEANKVKEQKLAALETDRQRELETRQLEAETLQQRKDAELFALSSEYQIKYDLAVKNGEDLLLLREFYAAKEASINKKYVEEEKKLDQSRLQSKIATLNEVALVLGAFATLAGEQSKAGKALTLAQIGVDTASAISSLTAKSEQNPANGATFGAAGALQFATGLIRILANIKKAKTILSSPSSATPSISAPSVSASAPIAPRQPEAQLTQLNQDSINAIGNSAIRAYVVETDITSNQKRVQAIKQRARFS
jgi:hypothetical protein